MDVLDGLATVPICVGYRIGEERCDDFPADLRRLQRCEPVVESMPGWSAPTSGATTFDGLTASPDGRFRAIARAWDRGRPVLERRERRRVAAFDRRIARITAEHHNNTDNPRISVPALRR